MERNYSERDLEQAIRRTTPGDSPRPDFEMWQQEHTHVVGLLSGRIDESANHDPSITWVARLGRNIMRNREVKLGTAAAVLLVALAAVYLNRGTSIAWSMEQTIAAIEQMRTLQVEGTVVWRFGADPGPASFRFWVQFPTEDSPLKMRSEVKNHIMIAQGDVVYECRADTRVAHVRHGPAITDLKYWYKAAELAPWLINEMPKMIQQYAEDWKQEIGKDPDTGDKRIIATCTFPPSNTFFLLVVNPESKLIEHAKLWDNLDHEGEPIIDAQTLVYNQELAAALFEVPADMTVVNQEQEQESRALFNQAEHLFHGEKKYVEAMGLYREVRARFPHTSVVEESQMMIGICYSHLGQHDKAIEAFQQAIREYPEGWAGVIQFYLGAAYMDNGQPQEALRAFEECLADAEGKRAPDQFPLKEAREYIAQIKGE